MTQENNLPKTWEEFLEKNYQEKCKNFSIYYNEAFTALRQLIQLRDCYRQGWKPDWEECYVKYGIAFFENTIISRDTEFLSLILSFFPIRRNPRPIFREFQRLNRTSKGVDIMIKVNFEYKREFPQGGAGVWKTSFKLFDDNITAEDLENKIAEELSKTECGYINFKRVTNIERI